MDSLREITRKCVNAQMANIIIQIRLTGGPLFWWQSKKGVVNVNVMTTKNSSCSQPSAFTIADLNAGDTLSENSDSPTSSSGRYQQDFPCSCTDLRISICIMSKVKP